MKNVSGCAIVNVLPYVFMSDEEPLNSSAERPLIAFRRKVAAAEGSAEVRSRPSALRSVHFVTAAPSANVSWFASNHIWRPAVTGGAPPVDPSGGVTAPVAAESAAADATELV